LGYPEELLGPKRYGQRGGKPSGCGGNGWQRREPVTREKPTHRNLDKTKVAGEEEGRNRGLGQLKKVRGNYHFIGPFKKVSLRENCPSLGERDWPGHQW